jgi:hypothetical protein
VVDAVFFQGGYIEPAPCGAIRQPDERDFAPPVACDDVEIGGWLFPGSVDRTLMGSYERRKAGPLMFEVPSLLPE